MNFRHKLLVAVAGIALIFVLGVAVPRISAQDRFELWKADIDLLAETLQNEHVNLFANQSSAQFASRVDALINDLSGLSDLEIMIRLSELIAAVGDSHTTIQWPVQQVFPLMTYWFSDGIYITNTVTEHARILNHRIVGINGLEIEEVIARLSRIIPHENYAQIKHTVPRQYLVRPDILVGLGIQEEAAPLRLMLVGPDGDLVFHDVSPVSVAQVASLNWAAPIPAPEEIPLYQRNQRVPYWFTKIDEQPIIYFQYNLCQEDPRQPFAGFSQSLVQAMDENNIRHLVVDLRLNSGGNSMVMRPFINEVANRPNWRVYVLTGRATFSSAILNALELQKASDVIFVGEATGGKPNHFGELKFVRLPNTGLTVSYSTEYFRYTDNDTVSLYPEVWIEKSIGDHLANRDPVLEWVVNDVANSFSGGL